MDVCERDGGGEREKGRGGEREKGKRMGKRERVEKGREDGEGEREEGKERRGMGRERILHQVSSISSQTGFPGSRHSEQKPSPPCQS